MLHCADVCCVKILGGPILECTPESMECTPESILATPKYSEYIGVYSYVLRVRSYIGENWQVYSYVLQWTPMYSRLQSVTQRASPRTIQSEKCRVGAGGRKWRVWLLCRSAHRTSRGAVLRASTSRLRVEEYL